MPIYISEDLQKYIKENYEIDLSLDDNISCKSYNINCCHARVWNSDTSLYPPNYGGYINYQCSHPKFNGSDLCEVHKQKQLLNKLTFGRIDQPPPENPILEDSEGNKITYYWLHQSEGMKNEDIFNKEEKEKQEKYNEKRGRGRPPGKKVYYNDIKWNELYEKNEINKLSLNSLKEYLEKNDLKYYGKKSELVTRIMQHIERQLENS